jgi:hypothetical protein
MRMHILKYKAIIIGTIVTILLSVNSLAGDFRKKTDVLINRLSSLLPDQWRLEEVNIPGKVWWMFYNKGEFIEIRLVGPKMSGYRYKLQTGETKDILFRNEGIYLWITPASFDDGWTLRRRISYRFSITYAKLPDVLGTGSGLKIYAEPGWVAEKSPYVQNVLEALPIYEPGAKKGSWPKWKADITKAVK